MRVIIHGVEAGRVTDDGRGAQEFPSFREAEAAFHDLDPDHNGDRFTRATVVCSADEVLLRFWTWSAERRRTAA